MSSRCPIRCSPLNLRLARQLPWPQPSDPQISVEHRLAEGDPAEEILRLSRVAPPRPHRDGHSWEDRTGAIVDRQRGGRGDAKGDMPGACRQDSARATADAATQATASHGEPVDVRPLGSSLVSTHTRTLVRTAAVEVVRLIIRAGQEVPQHRSKVKSSCIAWRGGRP